jgi:uncharacterized protein YndB with AHSA1/START domain
MPSPNGKLEDVDGRPALRFERTLAQEPERVWRALTDPGEQEAWHPMPARFEGGEGGRATFVEHDAIGPIGDGRITAYEPPRLLGYTWGVDGEGEPDHLLWELRPHDQGTLLVLVHTFDDRLKAARDGAGWHVCLDSLDASLGGPEAAGPDADGRTPWQRLNGDYQERFGISAEEATPPPSRA